MDRSNAKVAKDSSADSDSSDDISLIKLKEKLKEVNTSRGTNNKEAGRSDTNGSSDNEPLNKVAKRAVQADKKVKSGSRKKSADKEDDDSSDDEPLSVLATKLKPELPKEANVKNSRLRAKVMESKRTATRKRVKLAELSSDSSDNETLATVKQKLSKTDRVQKATPKQKKTKLAESLPTDSSSDDNFPPLAHFAKKKNGKTKVESQVGASGKSRERCDPSSEDEDEPLINLVKKRQAQRQVKTSEKTDTKPKRLEEKHSTGSSSDDDNETLANLVDQMKSGKQNTAAKSKLQGGASTQRRGDSEGSSEDEPLINLVKKRKVKAPQRKTRSPKKQAEKHVADKDSELSSDSSSDDDDLPLKELKAKRMLQKEKAKKKVGSQVSTTRKGQEIPEESSEDEPLINLLKKRKVQAPVKTPQRKTRSPKKQDKKHVAERDSKDFSTDSSSDDDDLPLAELKAKRMLGKENAKRKAQSQVGASRKTRGISDPSSEDEPLINLVKKRQAQSKVKAPQKSKTPTILREQQVHGSTSNWSDDEPAKRDAKHPQLTKLVKIILRRCDGEEAARSQNETGFGHAADVW